MYTRTGTRQRRLKALDILARRMPEATPAIIERDSFERVQVKLDDPERRRRAVRKYNYLLSGRSRCESLLELGAELGLWGTNIPSVQC